MRRFTLILIIVLFVLLVVAAVVQGPVLRQLRRHSDRVPSASPTATSS